MTTNGNSPNASPIDSDKIRIFRHINSTFNTPNCSFTIMADLDDGVDFGVLNIDMPWGEDDEGPMEALNTVIEELEYIKSVVLMSMEEGE